MLGRGGRRRTLEDANGGGEVVDAAGSLQGRSEDLNGGDKVVGEAVVEVTLEAGKDCISHDSFQMCLGDRPLARMSNFDHTI